MATFPGTLIPTGESSSARVNELVDEMLTPRLLAFRQVSVYDEQMVLEADGETWASTFGNWLAGQVLRVRKNGAPIPAGAGGYTDVDFVNGTLKAGTPDIGADNRPYDVVEVSYLFDYFPIEVLEGYLEAVVQMVNSSAVGPPTSYTIDTMPTHWDGVVTDLAFALCMERLILDYTLWKPRLVFAIGPGAMEGDSGDVVSQFETLKSNAEERAARTLENEKFKSGNYLSEPTAVYYAAVRSVGGWPRSGCAGGRLRGWKPNRIL